MTLTRTQTKVTPLDCGLTHPHGGPCTAGPYPVRPGAPRCDAALVTATPGGQVATVCVLALGHAGPCHDAGVGLGHEPPAVWASVPTPDPTVLPEPAEGEPAPSPDTPPADDDTPPPLPEEDAPHDPTTVEPANPTETDDDPDTLAGDPDDDPAADPFTEED